MNFKQCIFLILFSIFLSQSVFALLTIVDVEVVGFSIPVTEATWSVKASRITEQHLRNDGCYIQSGGPGYTYEREFPHLEIVKLSQNQTVLESTELVKKAPVYNGARGPLLAKGTNVSLYFDRNVSETYGLRISILPYPRTATVSSTGIGNSMCTNLFGTYDTLYGGCGLYSIGLNAFGSLCAPNDDPNLPTIEYLAVTRNCSVPSGKYTQKSGDTGYPGRFCIPLNNLN